MPCVCFLSSILLNWSAHEHLTHERNVLTLVELWFPRFGIYYCHYINYFAKAVFVQSYITHVALLKIDDRII